MSELEDLPSWAGRSTGAGQPAEEPKTAVAAAEAAAREQAAATQHLSDQPIPQQMQLQQPRRRRPLTVALFALLGLLALLAMGAGGYFLASSQDGTETEAAGESSEDDGAGQLASQELDEEASNDDAAAEAADDGENGETVTAEAETDADEAADAETDADSDTVTVDVDEAEEDATAAEDDAEEATDETTEAVEPSDERRAIFKGGKVYLQGAVPSEEIGLAIEAKAAAVVGPDNVVNEYEIDPESVIVPGAGAPLYVEDVVLFEFNSIEVARPFLPILDLGTLLLRQNPQATVTVVTRTDAVGSEEVNLDVATKRAQAVINYWLGKGVNPDQIKAEPLGEEGASEDDDEQTAALNRRAEFIIAGLLD